MELFLMVSGNNFGKLMEKINYRFKNEEYLKEALTHRSYANENSEFKNFDMAKYSKATFGMYHGEKTKLCIRFKNHMCGVFIDRFGKDVAFRKIDDEHSEFCADINVSPQFFGWIFSLGNNVKIISPDDVVDDMRNYAERFLENYK